nr:hypothetical protein [uncultured Lichenicoccus sp.]
MDCFRGGRVRLGLAVGVQDGEGLEPAKREAWSERLKTAVVLDAPHDVDARLAALLRLAWDAS